LSWVLVVGQSWASLSLLLPIYTDTTPLPPSSFVGLSCCRFLPFSRRFSPSPFQQLVQLVFGLPFVFPNNTVVLSLSCSLFRNAVQLCRSHRFSLLLLLSFTFFPNGSRLILHPTLPPRHSHQASHLPLQQNRFQLHPSSPSTFQRRFLLFQRQRASRQCTQGSSPHDADPRNGRTRPARRRRSYTPSRQIIQQRRFCSPSNHAGCGE
jgi:hypothetical protein